MARVSLETLADARSGDKGEASNVGVVARTEAAYVWLREHLTPELVASSLAGIASGSIERHDVPGIRALNFILHDSLGGGGSTSLLTDAQGKTHAQALLRIVLDVPDDIVPR